MSNIDSTDSSASTGNNSGPTASTPTPTSPRYSTTLRERVITKLLAQGFHEVPCQSRKYRMFQDASGDKRWVGKNGALRAGRNITESYSISHHIDKL